MRFWDSSSLVPLLLAQPQTALAEKLLHEDPELVLWWGTPIECTSALSRSLREGSISPAQRNVALALLQALRQAAFEIVPREDLRARAMRLLAVHPLRAADSLQLAAALLWAREPGADLGFVCFDDRLRTAARAEGFSVLPAD